MEIDKFLLMFRQTINEFYFLNGHFDTKADSKTEDYDLVFMRWKRDMAHKFGQLNLVMHWATSSPLISANQVILDILHKTEYLFEVKYRFGDALHPSFDAIIGEFERVFADFKASNEQYDFKTNDKTVQYDKYFSEWKKNRVNPDKDILVDILWGKNVEAIAENTLYLNLMYKDLFMFQVKYEKERAIENLMEEEFE